MKNLIVLVFLIFSISSFAVNSRMRIYKSCSIDDVFVSKDFMIDILVMTTSEIDFVEDDECAYASQPKVLVCTEIMSGKLSAEQHKCFTPEEIVDEDFETKNGSKVLSYEKMKQKDSKFCSKINKTKNVRVECYELRSKSPLRIGLRDTDVEEISANFSTELKLSVSSESLFEKESVNAKVGRSPAKKIEGGDSDVVKKAHLK